MFKSNIKVISLLLCFVFIFATFNFGITAQAKSMSDLTNEREKIQNEIDSTQKKINALSKEKKETEEYIAVLRSKIELLQDKINSLQKEKSTLQAEIDAVQEKIKKTEAELIALQKEIDAKQAEFDENYELYTKRLKAMYVSGSVSNLEVLLTCEDMSAMFTRSQMIKSVAERDSAALEDLMNKMEEIEAGKKSLEEKRNEMNEDKKNLESDKASLQKRIDEIDTSKKELDSEAAEVNELMKKINAQQGEYMELIETNQEEIAAIEDEIRRASITPSYDYKPAPGGTGQFRYPTDSTTISAGYPRYSNGSWHGGVDFPVSTGSNVYAAADGMVSLVKYLNTSYGYHVMINHGNGISTLYAHNSQILVSPGQTVSKGQVIAKSGSTGNSSGPHCHFEVRVNGEQVNPLSYL